MSRSTSETTHGQARDRGAALVLTLFATTLVMILGTTILTSTVGNLRSARLSQDSAGALAAAEAGVAQGTAHLRRSGLTLLTCAPNCATPGYGSRTNPAQVTLPRGAGRYAVWFEPIAPLPANNPGRYLLHSTGWSGRGVRQLEVEVEVGTRPIGLPMAIFAKSVNGGGNTSVTRESILSTGCVDSRAQITMRGIDAAFGIPAAVHSSQYISMLNQSTTKCGPGRQSIHPPVCNGDLDSAGTRQYAWDQSVRGGAFTSGSAGYACAGPRDSTSPYYKSYDFDNDGAFDVEGSAIRNANGLRKLFGIPEQPFTDAQLENLREVARAQGTYFTRSDGDWPSRVPTPAQQPNTVLFFDLPEGGDLGGLVDLKDIPGGDFPNGWGRPAQDANCAVQSLLIVIVGGDARLNSDRRLTANIVLTSSAPYGHVFKANGTADLIGTIYADTLDLTGDSNVSLDLCFMQNLSPALVDTTLTVTNYREVDRTG